MKILAHCRRRSNEILPGTGRGTIRRMVEGARHVRIAQPPSPSTTRCASDPPPRTGED